MRVLELEKRVSCANPKCNRQLPPPKECIIDKQTDRLYCGYGCIGEYLGLNYSEVRFRSEVVALKLKSY